MPLVPDSRPRPTLSPLELRVLRGLAEGRTMRELAAELSYSYEYLREVRANIIRRFGASTIVQAAVMAARYGLLR